MDPHHYPADVLELLVQGIPRLFRSKQAVIDFFRGAGVADRLIVDFEQKLRADVKSVTKRDLARTVLVRMNADGDASLGARREVIKRIVEHQDFASAWPEDVTAAKAFVSDVRQLVAAKDAVTRIEEARQHERRERLAEKDRELADIARRRAEYLEIRERLFALFGETNAWKRGKALEGVLNDLCRAHGNLVREAFTLRGRPGEGIVEQIDGVISLDGQIYLVELKWHESKLGHETIAQHWSRVATRDGARGLFISASGYTPAAIAQTRDGLALRTFVLVELEGIVKVMQNERCVQAYLRECATAAVVERDPRAEIDVGTLPRFPSGRGRYDR